MKLILLGAPGAGKGTQAFKLAKMLGVPAISTGNMLRDAMKNGTEIGLKARSYMDSGRLVPDEVVLGIVKERLSQSDCADGYILDGMPRTIPQARALEEMGIHPDHVVSIEIADEVIEQRMTGRRVCGGCGAGYHTEARPPKEEGICDLCGTELTIRKDDDPETVKNRLKIFHAETEALKEFYAEFGIVRTVEGDRPMNEVTAAILRAIEVEA